ncbi:MAG TPA: aspartate-semialdehyde dehydrogenase [Candidatus Binatia bacterium]|nr:aspartate-semialdehyde dehydrogenase [Candidatus Binatia bacterium]
MAAADALGVAVVGAAGLVGEEIVGLLRERRFPLGELRLLGSVRTAGKVVEEDGRRDTIGLLGPRSFADMDLVFFAAGPAIAGEHAPAAAAAGAAVIDCSSRFRLADEVPLVVPEVNAERIGERRAEGIVASPSATAIALAVVLEPLATAAGLRRVTVSTYQGVASAGRRALHGLSRETVDLLNSRGARRSRFARPLAFNCVPQVGTLEPGGSSTHELQVAEEVRKILDAPALGLFVTAVRVPTFFGTGLSVTVETDERLDAAAATAALRAARGVLVHGGADDAYPTPNEVAGSDATHVGRVRDDPTVEHGLGLWVAIDSVRKGAALNAVQIAEILIRDYL